MYALAMPISSRIADERLAACFCANSPRILEERAATSWQTLASSSVWLLMSFMFPICIFPIGSGRSVAHDAVAADRACSPAGIVQVVQVGDRLAHRKKSLVRVERPAEEQLQQVCGAFRFFKGLH